MVVVRTMSAEIEYPDELRNDAIAFHEAAAKFYRRCAAHSEEGAAYATFVMMTTAAQTILRTGGDLDANWDRFAAKAKAVAVGDEFTGTAN